MAAVYQLPGYSTLREPFLAFHPLRPEDKDVHPLRGLATFGPFGQKLVNSVRDPIRIATIVPEGEKSHVGALIAELDRRHKPKERFNYLVEFPGFRTVFGLRVVLADACAHIEIPRGIDKEITQAAAPHLILADALTKAIEVLERRSYDFDVLVIYLPERWQPAFYGLPGEDFDLHDYIKAITAVKSLPTQVVRQDSVFTYFCRCSVMWRLAIGLYCKAGGVPWKLADTEPETAYMGLSYSIRPTEAKGLRFVTCCSQVFDSEGAGLQFIAYETDEAHVERDNPFLGRTDMRKVMTRSLDLYQRRHAGQLPKKLIVHKSTEFKPDEVEGCFDAWSASEGLELLQVQQDSLWRGVNIDPPLGGRGPVGQASPFPCLRGTTLQLGTRDVLVWTQGNAPVAANGKNFFKEGKGIPAALLLTRFAGHGGLEEGARSTLALTKMNWNNDSLYDRLPVTLSYARILARTIKRMPVVSSKPYEFRYFM